MIFSNNAYESLYVYLGLSFQEKVREFLLSQSFFQYTILMIFGILFLVTSWKFFSKYLPPSLVQKRSIPLSRIFKVVLFLFLGLSILRVQTETRLLDFKGASWHDNQYIQRGLGHASESHKVSLLFDILSRTAEGIGATMARLVDHIFARTHSQLEAPDFYYKAVMYSSTATIDDKELKDQIAFYTEECLDQVLPMFEEQDTHFFRKFFTGFDSSSLDNKLESIKIGEETLINGKPESLNCLTLKEDLSENFRNYAHLKNNSMYEHLWAVIKGHPGNFGDLEAWENLTASNLLANHFLESRESGLGLQKGALLPTTTGRVVQHLNKFTDFFDSALSITEGTKELHGISLAAKRAKEFSEFLTRAPHLKGGLKLILITIFDFLVILVVAGRWKWVLYWFAAYLSVCMWEPIWNFLYHLVTNLDLAISTMKNFDELKDGVSVYSGQILGSRMYYLYSVYSWAQLILGPGFTATILVLMRPMLQDHESEKAPEFLSEGATAATKVAGFIP